MAILLMGLYPGLALSSSDEAHLKTMLPQTNIVATAEKDEMLPILDEVEIAVGFLPVELLGQMPRLRWYQQWFAGADWLLKYPDLVDKDFILTSVSGIHAIPIGEHIMAMLLGFARVMPLAYRAQQKREWLMPPFRQVFELTGKTMLLIGMGGIGAHTAQLAQAFGMRVIGMRRNPAEAVPNVEIMVSPSDLATWLPQADFVVLTIPLTAETHHFIGLQELKLMKPDAYLINIGRGGLLDEASLILALQEKWIAGAGLDVFETEPLPPASPLWGIENVIITTHYAGVTPAYYQRSMAVFMENLKRYQQGKPLRNVVDKQCGY